MKLINRLIKIIVFTIFLLIIIKPEIANAVPLPDLNVDIELTEEPEEIVSTLQILLILTILAIAPAIVMMMTSFTRIIVVLSFTRNALATQQTPPNQVLIGLALFLTLFVMTPAITEINENALQPYIEGEIDQGEAFDLAISPLRDFMLRQTRENDLILFLNHANIDTVTSYDDIPTYVLIPSFIISELKTAFQIGFILYLPFLVVDMIVASTLMSMGMLMLPPVMISLPFKILLFIMVDGWNILIQSILIGF